MARIWMVIGALSGLIAVAMAAYASHGLPPEVAGTAMTGASLQAWHALALLIAGMLVERRRGPIVPLAAACFAFGTLLFSGGIYLRVLTGISLGMVVPLGGMALLVGWGLLAAGAALAPER